MPVTQQLPRVPALQRRNPRSLYAQLQDLMSDDKKQVVEEKKEGTPGEHGDCLESRQARKRRLVRTACATGTDSPPKMPE